MFHRDNPVMIIIQMAIVAALAIYFWQFIVAVFAFIAFLALPVAFLSLCVRPGYGY